MYSYGAVPPVVLIIEIDPAPSPKQTTGVVAISPEFTPNANKSGSPITVVAFNTTEQDVLTASLI